jgi:hypothetical protein
VLLFPFSAGGLVFCTTRPRKTDEGTVFVYGKGQSGQLGLGPDIRKVNMMTPIATLEGKCITSISTGFAQSAAVSGSSLFFFFFPRSLLFVGEDQSLVKQKNEKEKGVKLTVEKVMESCTCGDRVIQSRGCPKKSRVWRQVVSRKFRSEACTRSPSCGLVNLDTKKVQSTRGATTSTVR